MKKSLVIIVIFTTGCGHLDISQFPQEKPVMLGTNGWSSLALSNECNRLKEKFNIPAIAVPVHYWNWNLDEVETAKAEGRRIILIGYSAGWHQQAVLFAEECRKRDIEIDLLVGIDPSYTVDHDFYVPSNVKEIILYFSTAKGDLMAWARGNENKIRATKDPRIKSIRYLSCSHLKCITQPTLQTDLEELIKHYSLSTRLALSKN